MKDDIKVEILMQKLHINGKNGIKFPIKEKDAKRYLTHYKYLIDQGFIQKEKYNELVQDVNSRSLDENLYNEFCDCLSMNKSGMMLVLKT
jgi:hypothetical protein